MLLECNQFLQEAHERLLQAQEHAKLFYDAKRMPMEFGIGDRVRVKLLHCAIASLPGQMNDKLAPRFYGLYQILGAHW